MNTQKLLVAAACVLTLSAAPAVLADNFEPLQMPLKLGDVVRNLDVNERGPDGSTPLQWAVYDGNIERVKALIAAGADVNAVNNYGANAMQLAAEVANIELLRLLLDAGADVDSPNPEGQTTLMLVARTGNVDAAKLLVAHGATIDAREGWGEQTALMWASARRHPAMMEYLIKLGADVNARSAVRDYNSHLTEEGRAKNLDRGGLTPLLYAARENCKACVDVLIAHDVELDKPDPDGVSPLLLAILNSNRDIARQLIGAGADIHQWDIFGRAPLFSAVASRDDAGYKINQAINETDGMSLVQILLEQGANPNMQLFFRPANAQGGPRPDNAERAGPLSRGSTPLIMAASKGDADVIKLLLQYGAEADLPQADLQTPVSVLMMARAPDEQLIEGLNALVEAGADVNVRAVPHHVQRSRGGTPLHYAVRARHDKAIEALVAAGADIDARDVDGLTALDYAMDRGFVGFPGVHQPPDLKLVGLLRSLGAGVELDVTPFWPPVGAPFYYPWSIFPLDPEEELRALVPGSFDHQ
ncbi:MAG: ankyrin repeat domain-containing protein [Pseudomonadales bacterium]|nr:ankyrin repeat domain-containing protein [Pseudomonadales bacterium]